MRIYFYNENSEQREGISRIIEEGELPDDFDEMTREDQEKVLKHTEDCSFFRGSQEEISKEAQRWAELPDTKKNTYMRNIGRDVLDIT